MSTKNRENRAAKQKARARRANRYQDGVGQDAAERHAATVNFVGRVLWEAASGPSEAEARMLAAELASGRHGARRSVDTAVDLVLRRALGHTWTGGWQPYDVFQIARRRLTETGTGLLVDAIAGELGQRAAASVHWRWRAQLDEIGAVVWWEADRPQFGQWAEKHGHTHEYALGAVIAALAMLMTLPKLPEIPLPDEGSARTGVDERMLAKVRGLLAKAESSQFPEEAEALSAKAQELMSRYSFERALVEAEQGSGARGTGRRFWLDNPYPGAKASLVSAVAKANRCRAVSYEKLGFVALVGHEVDLELVELLSTSLLVQATEAMLTTGRQVTRTGQSRTRSFRQSFLLAYAQRIGERLAEADHATSEQVSDERLLPVLARRTKEVDDLFETMFPEVVLRARTISNHAGWDAGRAAAEAAKLGVDRARIT
ncbi:DUF2786 domain-containing protein [Amycolatopsis minnesotensis]|uniref:DUF2786 domain-containing protein n=1 Tax=Amycolatopsis minnesotensis TaxID=337894 RepID=A0ABP5E659_9PSEU